MTSMIRIKSELKNLILKPEPFFKVYFDPQNLYNIHFSVLGPIQTAFTKGIYHGVIFLPRDYPFSAPDIQFYNNNGRFEVKKNICTNFTSFHQELWSATWGIRQVIIGLRSMFDEETPGAIGSITISEEQRKIFAEQSIDYICECCGSIHKDLELNDIQNVPQYIKQSEQRKPLSDQQESTSNTSQFIIERSDSIQEYLDDKQEEQELHQILDVSQTFEVDVNLQKPNKAEKLQIAQALYNYIYYRK
ncbi:Ubiquitin-conjugating enzyme E2 [Spironucleus salmonicida]|uniref:Ubiquitin-conjugating enzyme E2 n=1 Tax=Spironucleus salmonicida TaxID=348837 RepID=V6LN79_9EUKA|nr:Ubiquitin-conjugating enzyme E2 [Spironucleus salmonicida]|eukprot:EST46090.1 Ubiquitin-conjugating enzyme E2 [Spironucleus salmonicida]